MAVLDGAVELLVSVDRVPGEELPKTAYSARSASTGFTEAARRAGR